MLSPGALPRPGAPGPPGPSCRTDRFDHGFRAAAPARKASVHQVSPRLYSVLHRHLGTGAGRRRLPRATSLRAAPPACWQGVTVVYAPSCPLRSQASRRWFRAAFFCLLCCISSGYAWTVAWAPARLTSLPPVPSPGALRLCDLRPLGFLRQAVFAPPVGASPGFGPRCPGVPRRPPVPAALAHAGASHRPRLGLMLPPGAMTLGASLRRWLRRSSSTFDPSGSVLALLVVPRPVVPAPTPRCLV